MPFRRSLIATSLALLAASPTYGQQSENTVRFAYGQSLENPNPYFTTLRLGVILGRNVWDTLVTRDLETGEFAPLLATEWQWIDETTLEMSLREGVSFHDGSSFEAEDVVATLSYVADPDNRIVSQQVASWIESVEQVDEYTVLIHTAGPAPSAMEFLSTQLAIFPAEYFTGPVGESDAPLPVGTGPFQYTEYTPGGDIVLSRFADYFATDAKGAASLDRVVIRTVPDVQTQVAGMLSGELDFLIGLPRDQADQLGTLPSVNVESGETMRIVFLQINTTETGPNAALRDLRVRQALNYAIDKEAISSNLVGEGSTPINAVCFIDQFGCTEEGITAYPYDPERARELLAEAGYADGLTIELAAYRDRNLSEAIINYLGEVGVTVTLNYLQPAALRDGMRAHTTELVQMAWGSYSIYDLSASTPVYYGGQPDDNNMDPDLIAILDQTAQTTDPEIRAGLFQQALARIADQAYAVPMFSLPIYYAGAEGLRYETYPDEILRFWNYGWE
ncbi:ABC transporter substrate-binding protein [Pararhodobacter marinus]|uniref:ABC transporter substrate-binding protein n=1 Tax=Pararhodobacter marinus TaxID=2184063 RepID=A0A2U2C6V7_9RHOB|nr:ABC transporter substrate-binding protein [Pararhodobacter marinus]PWE27620.1 ABC transporter substrate-binding protein [Pararhodobacter marinus]